MRICLVLIGMLVATVIAQAKRGGDIAGNGGDGIFIGDQIYNYDLVEHGIHRSPFFDRSIAVPEQVAKLVDANLALFPTEVRSLVAYKLAEVHSVDRVFYTALAVSLKSFQWNIISDFTLIEIDDEDGSDVNIPRDLFRQVAVRSLRTIKMDGSLLARMNYENIAAMIFHETIYAIIPLEHLQFKYIKYMENIGHREVTEYYQHQSSRRARELTAYLFSPRLIQRGLDGLKAIVGEGIPVAIHPGTEPFRISLQNYYFSPTDEAYAYGVNVSVEIKEKRTFAPLDSSQYEAYKQEACVANSASEFMRVDVARMAFGPKFETYKGYDRTEFRNYTYLNLRHLGGYRMDKNLHYRPDYHDFLHIFPDTSRNQRECMKTFEEAWKALSTHL